jgi:hypothetical protein
MIPYYPCAILVLQRSLYTKSMILRQRSCGATYIFKRNINSIIIAIVIFAFCAFLYQFSTLTHFLS